jgi:hypothetical protein
MFDLRPAFNKGVQNSFNNPILSRYWQPIRKYNDSADGKAWRETFAIKCKGIQA